MSTEPQIKPKGLVNTPQRPMGPMGRGGMVLGVQKARDFNGTVRKLFSYLRATNLEVGLLLHIGREPKFARVVCENRLKRHVNAPAHDPRLP